MNNKGGKTAKEIEKERLVQRMFATISGRYDLLNRLLSGQQDQRWRAFAADRCDLKPGDWAIDICTGTADIAIQLARRVGGSGVVVGLDFCVEMIEIGRRKAAQNGLSDKISFVQANAESIPFPDNTFIAATNAFALRNVANIERTLQEMHRIVKPGGRVVVLELAKPQIPLLREMYGYYFYRIVPIIGGIISGNGAAYRYLPRSLNHLPPRNEILRIFNAIGLRQARCYDLTLGIATVFVGIKS